MNANIYRTGPNTWEANYGSSITNCIRDAIEINKIEGNPIEFNFNGVTISINKTSDAAQIYRAWEYGMAGLLKVAGPGPAPDLDVELAEVELERAKREKARREAQNAKDAIIIAKVDAEIDGVALEYAPGGEEAWAACSAKNQDSYGGGTVRYAERWGRLMQARIKSGATVASVQNQASHDADAGFGMSGFTHSFAKSMLREWWIHGAQL